ncbi:MAG: hypothetical protein ACUVSY_15315 [Roseiflexus sp.]
MGEPADDVFRWEGNRAAATSFLLQAYPGGVGNRFQCVAQHPEGEAQVGKGKARVGEGVAQVGKGKARVDEGKAQVGKGIAFAHPVPFSSTASAEPVTNSASTS